MAFNPNIQYNDCLSLKDNVKAAVNWLNWVCREISIGRVPQNKEIAGNALLQTQADFVEAVIDEYNSLIEV